ncbi:MAG: FmdB family zinc ribbon protein [Armatimonadota bacterium]
MPIYEFECEKCGHRFEVMMGFDEEPPRVCPQEGCEGKVTKLFSPPAIIFKGSGFHVNDYGSNGPKGGRSSGSCSTGSCPASSSSDGS